MITMCCQFSKPLVISGMVSRYYVPYPKSQNLSQLYRQQTQTQVRFHITINHCVKIVLRTHFYIWKKSRTKCKAKHPYCHSPKPNSVYLKQPKCNCYIMIQLFSANQSVFKLYVSPHRLYTGIFTPITHTQTAFLQHSYLLMVIILGI